MKKMKDTEVAQVFEQIAKQEGITADQVRQEIQKLIDDAIKNLNPAVQERWKRIPSKGDTPTPEEIIRYIVNQLCMQ